MIRTLKYFKNCKTFADSFAWKFRWCLDARLLLKPKWRKGPPTSWLPVLPVCKKSSGETVHAASVKKTFYVPANFQVKTSHSVVPGPVLWKDKDPDSTGTSFLDFEWWRRSQDAQPAFLFAQYPQSWLLFCFREVKLMLAPLAVPGPPHDKLIGGRWNQQQKRVRPLPFGGGWTASNSTLKKSWNSKVSKMIHIEVISPYPFASEHPSYIIRKHISGVSRPDMRIRAQGTKILSRNHGKKSQETITLKWCNIWTQIK
jgi:hypothetical protein